MSEQQRERFRWGWIFASALLGIGLVAVAHLGDLSWRWPPVTTGVIGNLGAAFLIAFVLFLFERRFTQRIVERVKDVAEAAVTSRTEFLDSRLDSLEERLNTRRAEQQAAQDEAVEAIANDVSFESITRALLETEHVGATRGAKLIVPGSSQTPRLSVQFEFAASTITRGDGQVLNDGTVPRLTVQVQFEKRQNEFFAPIIQADWTADMTSDAIGSDLETELRRRDRLPESKVFDFPLALRNLQAGLQLALENQRAPVGEEVFEGKLCEVVTDDWIVTTAGVQNLRTGVRVAREELGFGTRRSYDANSPKKSLAPEGVDQTTWNYVTYRAGQQPAPNIFD